MCFHVPPNSAVRSPSPDMSVAGEIPGSGSPGYGMNLGILSAF